MSTEGRAVRIPSGPRYRLVATFASGATEITRDGFDSVFAAQAEVGPFVCDIAIQSRPTSIRLERVEQGDPASNGKSDATDAAVTFKRWDEPVIDRILRQHSGAAPQPPVDARAGNESRGGDASRTGATAAEPDQAFESDPARETEISPVLEPQIAIPRDEPVPHPHRRPGHRRTRWHLILAVALVVVLAGLLLLADANGDPVGYFRALRGTSTVRETLPFRSGKPPASSPTSRSAVP